MNRAFTGAGVRMLKGCLKPSLNKKLVAMMLFLSLGLISVLVFLYYHTEKTLFNEFERQTADLSKAIQIGIGEVAGSPVADEKRLKEYLKKLDAKGVREISVISTSDRIVASTNPEEVGKWVTKSKKELIFRAELGQPVTSEGQAYDVMIPVVSGEKHLGYIHLKINTEDFSAFLQMSALRRIIAAFIIFGIGTALAVFLAKRYTKPIEEVVMAARGVAAGDLSRELPVGRRDEIGELARSFNFMVGKLKEERELREKLRRAEHMAGIGQFSRSIAHEIKNPLNFISLSIDYIKESFRPSDAGRAEKLDHLLFNMKKEIQRISRFSESFLEFGKPLELALRRTNMGELIDDVVELVSAMARKEKIEVKKELEARPELSIDPDFIRTCLYNVIKNAFQAMPGGGRLTIGTSQSNGSFRMSFKDTGHGMPKEIAGKVFDPFFTTKAGGLGLGLAFTKRVVEEHGGKVSFESSEGKGSSVAITLPLNEKEEGR